MRVTIVTPILDGARFLEAMLDSVKRQTYTGWQHIIVDGGSTDATLEILERRASEDSRIRVVSKPGSSLYEALFEALDLVSPDSVVGWINADDLYPEWAISCVLRYMVNSEDGPQWVSGLPALWDSAGLLRGMQVIAWRPRYAIRNGWFHDDFLGCLQQEAIFFQKSLIDGLSAEERQLILSQKLAGDFALWKALARQTSLITLPLLLGGFRVHGENRSTRQATAYSDEVRQIGCIAPPVWLARRFRTLFELISSAVNVFAFRRAASDLHGSSI